MYGVHTIDVKDSKKEKRSIRRVAKNDLYIIYWMLRILGSQSLYSDSLVRKQIIRTNTLLRGAIIKIPFTLNCTFRSKLIALLFEIRFERLDSVWLVNDISTGYPLDIQRGVRNGRMQAERYVVRPSCLLLRISAWDSSAIIDRPSSYGLRVANVLNFGMMVILVKWSHR